MSIRAGTHSRTRFVLPDEPAGTFTFEIPSTTVPVIETNPLNMPRVTRPQPVQRPPPPPPLSDSSDDSADSDESGNGTVV